MKKLMRFIKKNSSVILAGLAVVGVVGTAVVATVDSRNADVAVDEVVNERGELTTAEKVKVAWPYYIPTILVSGLTISCIVSCHILNKKQQAAILSAYMASNHYISEYQKKVREEIGVEREKQIREEVRKELAKRDDFIDRKYDVRDEYSGLTFKGITLDRIYRAQIECSNDLNTCGWVDLETYYKWLGVYDQVKDFLKGKENYGFSITFNVSPFYILMDMDYSDPDNPVIVTDFDIKPGDEEYWEYLEGWM